MVFEGTTFDNMIHLLTAIVAITLFTIALTTYNKNKRSKFLFICLAFFLFAVKEIVTVVEVLFYSNPFIIGVAHFLNFVVLILFFIGVTK